MAHQVTVKGQVTIPKKVREYLGIGPGSGVEFEVDSKGTCCCARLEGLSRAPVRAAVLPRYAVRARPV